VKHFHWQGPALVLRCHIQANARKDEFCGLHGERLKIRLKAAPVNGEANRQLVDFIANAFAVPRSAVSILRGSGSRHKDLQIQNPEYFPAQCLLVPSSTDKS
jgi:uncharacterized protein (TIGR00251 family)